MAIENSKEKALFEKYAAKVNELLKEDTDGQVIFDCLAQGETTYMRQDRIENTSFDLTWIQVIEDCLYDLGCIVKNPKITTKTVEDLVPVELARKTDQESVKHLASHTQYIKDVDEEGDIIPSKILNIGNDDEYHTYENRFIATLIRRLVLFVDKRYEYVKDYVDLHDQETLLIKNKSHVDGVDVELETKVKVISKKTDPVSKANAELIQRIGTIRKYLIYYYRSDFMKQMKNERDVRNPILQTNIIRKNPQYHHCFRLYRFIESYDLMGASYTVNETFSLFNGEELHELNCLMLANYLALQGKDKSVETKTKQVNFKPRVLTSSDDEQFEYGPYYQGPIQFVRVDAAYRKYLDRQTKNPEVPDKLSEHEEAYYADEIEKEKLSQEQVEEETKLLQRKSNEKIQFDAHVKDVIARRDLEEQEYREYLVEKRLREEDVFLTKSRQNIVEEARKFRFDLDKIAFVSYSYEPSDLDSALIEAENNALSYEFELPPELYTSVYQLLTHGLKTVNRGQTIADIYKILTQNTNATYSSSAAIYKALTSNLEAKKSKFMLFREQRQETYVVLTLEGYYLSQGHFTHDIHLAKRIPFEEAKRIAKEEQGRIYRL